MDDPKVRQEGSTVGHDQAGRDINNYVVYNAQKITYMSRLIEKFKEERKDDAEFYDIIEQLQHYKTQVHDEDVIGLEPKLAAGKRTSFLQYAQLTKERFTKKLVMYQSYKSAQQIYVYLLAEICSRYIYCVYPKISENASSSEISMLVQTMVIDPVREMLEENILELHAEDISGMLYFLTGNCHIKWV